MAKKVTIQDIADELHLSRNTISKAINNTGNVAPETKNIIFKKAAEMGYKQFPILQAGLSSPMATSTREIALFTKTVPNSQPLTSALIDSFQKKISMLGYRLIIYILRDDVISSLTFPENFSLEKTTAILCTELFDKRYTEFICSQNIPTLFIDSFANVNNEKLPTSLMLMENTNSVSEIMQHLFESGCEKIGFVGDNMHCQSFYERWKAYQAAMKAHKVKDYKDYSILADDKSPYNDALWLSEQIKSLKALPDAFVCANDYLAICTIKALRQLGYQIPRDIKIAGFDNSNESDIIDPALTTVTIYGKQMGYMATEILLSRVKYPDIPNSTTYVNTDVIFRKSTGDK